MKYFVLTADGAADRRLSACGGKSPMEAAAKPTMNMLSYRSFNGLVSNLPENAAPAPYVVDLSVLGCDPALCTGTLPFEAAGLGAAVDGEDTVFRCSLVSLSEGNGAYAGKTLTAANADDVTPEEAAKLISALNKGLSTKIKKFYNMSGTEHCLVWKRAPQTGAVPAPADIKGKKIGSSLPSGEAAARIVPMLEKSYALLKDHPVNVKRRSEGKKALNSIWLWNAVKRPDYENFPDKWKVSCAAVSTDRTAVGVGAMLGMKPTVAADNAAAVAAVIAEFEAGTELVYVYAGAAAEAARKGDAAAKTAAIEATDTEILAPVYEYLCGCGDQFKLLVSTGAPVLTETREYSTEPSPFFLYNSTRTEVGYKPFSELNAAKGGFCLPDGYKFVPFMIRLPAPAPEKEETPEDNGQQQ